jgi:transcriptional regulator with XRE-family HTH domain
MHGEDQLREQARRLRSTDELTVAQIGQRLGVGRHRVQEWLADLPVPSWARRPNAKDDLRARAVALRSSGRTVPAIAEELGVARSTAFRWVRDLPLAQPAEEAVRRRAHSRLMTDARWSEHRRARQARRSVETAQGRGAVGALNARDLLLAGAVLFWCEGTKEKPWRSHDGKLTVINTDPRLLRLFLAFLESLGWHRSELSYRVSIHETADHRAAEEWWIAELQIPSENLRRATLKRHKISTSRRNQGDGYHGCLVISAPRARELYWRIEGIIAELDDQSRGALSGESR